MSGRVRPIEEFLHIGRYRLSAALKLPILADTDNRPIGKLSADKHFICQHQLLSADTSLYRPKYWVCNVNKIWDILQIICRYWLYLPIEVVIGQYRLIGRFNDIKGLLLIAYQPIIGRSDMPIIGKSGNRSYPEGTYQCWSVNCWTTFADFFYFSYDQSCRIKHSSSYVCDF